ncbi:ATP-binding protein [Mesorhizobium sp. A556]
MTSIRSRLITILIGTTGLVWLLAAIWIYQGTRSEVEHVLDARLTEAARMVNSLLTDQRIELAMTQGEGGASTVPGFVEHPYERQLSCQIWSLNGQLVGRSENAPEGKLSSAGEGFSETNIDGETWRVYTVENAGLGVRVMVGDSVRIRDRLVGDVVKGLVLPGVLILPILAGMIWLSVRRGLSPLNMMADTLSKRAANDLRELPATGLPKEIAPAVNALNGLFKRVEEARERERSFTAFAAHELKTPLAGLKTQAQIALGSSDRQVHANALRQISAGVDRTARLVKQLLDLTSLEASDAEPVLVPVDVKALVDAAVAELNSLRSVKVEVVGGDDEKMTAEPHFLTLAVRNLLENAINHSPEGGVVTCRIVQSDAKLTVCIEDDGPGVPEAELSRVTEKFFRGRNKSSTGSGLGLAIAEIAMARIGGEMRFRNRQPHGFSATLIMPFEKAST